MKYIIYCAVAVLIVWSVVYLFRKIRAAAKGEDICGNCSDCSRQCDHRKEDK